jgi:transmembrane sensor
VLSIACVSAVWLRYGPPGQDTYATTVGEIRRLVLPDGSVVELNTRSKIRIDFDARRRDVHLDRGEAFFTVARDAARPFRVSSHAAQIRAIGTRFSVYRQPSRTLVTVLEGIVAVQPETSPAQGAIELTAGHQVSVEADPDHASAGARAVPVDAARATSWRQHRLIFDNQPLSAVVAEFNRYNRQQLVLEDAALAAEGISGVFDSDKPQALVLFLTGNGSARATRLSDTRILLTQPEREIP